MKRILLLSAIASLLLSCNQKKETKTVNNVASDTSSEYHLVWSDEFNTDGMPDTTKWSYDVEGNKWQWGNNELQAYTANRSQNVKITNGVLEITAIKEKYNDPISTKTFDYTSTRLVSQNKGDWLYGKFVIRAKLPSGRGTWPAIWMLPTDWKYGKWPNSGEIDIMEHVGYEKDSIYASAHTASYHHSIGTNKTKAIAIKDAESEFHEYIVEWGPEEYSVFVDDQKYFTFKNEHNSYKEWPYDQRFHMILNLAVGGMWGGLKGIDEAIWPQTLYIDYVRVYQK
ncbi:glycoside hydrolase family 16 protein [Flammeovirga kamogawensis]|uniref:Glycoside hydrolase family 16 protein n=1 Tax=Flammeovirga kamogawensis TaxID=373891 RepID=A0ABX8H0E5_9BACT|nr:glycoside hydrolase family 16 protein [Flammeovirga kamogawensis]MBB6459076.1 beta-glucanase (GH16 family) [Flammeovirga kamogawensis]QWG08645.1 glycoside hydrolase family 16 protein [Flammeovirga kamogawensis]TRX66938.1 glycoside hydrolase family 16 protein [Flammeovirga kamogawensis]